MPNNTFNSSWEEFQTFIREQSSAYNYSTLNDLSTWSSMQTLMVISAIDEAYDVLISFDELEPLQELKELFELIQQKDKG